MAEHFDEAGGDGEVRGIDDLVRMSAIELTNGGDAVAADADIGRVPWAAGAIDDAAVLDQDIKRCVLLRVRRRCSMRAGVSGRRSNGYSKDQGSDGCASTIIALWAPRRARPLRGR